MTNNQPIILKKVKVNNLQNVDLTLEPNQLIVFTGVSGSGKSSLAFDTIYVEGQRRYIESLSHQARRNLGDLPKPDAESITGIAPTIAIEQKQAGNNPRSTVGTMTGIYDCMRVLFARIGIPHCPVSKKPVEPQSIEKIIATIQKIPSKIKIILLSPIARNKKGEFKEEFAELLTKGFTRVRVNDNWAELGDIESLDGNVAHDIDLVIDRIQIQEENFSRIGESTKLALEQGNGLCSIFLVDSEEEIHFSEYAYCHDSGLSYPPLEPHDFSFNHPAGMCPECHGLGISREFDLKKIIDPDLSIEEDCCSIASSYQTVRYGNIYRNLAKQYKFKLNTPWKNLSEKAKQVFLYGTEQKWTKMEFVHPQTHKIWIEPVRWTGVIAEAKERFTAAKSEAYRTKMGEKMVQMTCRCCKGSRIKPYPSETTIGDKKIAELSAMTLEDLDTFFQNLNLSDLDFVIGGELVKEIKERIGFLLRVGVHYLTLDRTAPTLSGGESQRVRLASQIGAGLVGAIYVLDEPSIGLHPIDHHRLIHTLTRLRDMGNTVIVVEHDIDTMLAADTIVDVGPGAGKEGGHILCVGDIFDVMKNQTSLTGKYLSKKLEIEIPKKRKILQKHIEIIGASHHNLKNVSAKIPLGGLICVTGVSGSGKSSLITDILYPALANHFHHAKLEVGAHLEIKGIDQIDKIIAVDQSPIGRTPRSNAATYIKLFDDIRDLFTHLPESQLRGFKVGHFSFNVKEGSCSYCSGLGSVKIDMDFMEDAWIQCPQCKGKRFEPEILAVKYKGKSIHDILETDVEEALTLFDAIPTIRKKLEMLHHVGLNYLTLGQSSTTLSGGEAQRVKLAKELVRPGTGKTLYLLDEPSTGLHFHDIRRMIDVLQKLVDKGNTVLVIEHNMDLVKTADWVIELGPKAGKDGGQIIAQGTPENLAKLTTPTGIALKNTLFPTPILPCEKQTTFQELQTFLRVEKAKQNNLKGFDLTIPRGKMTVLTGPSGSGKSSLAFETIYAEGQRRYTETLPPFARSFIKQLPKPKVDRIEGLSPSIALEQKTGGLNPRSTIGTITEIYDLLRVLFAHMGTPYCPESNLPIRHISKEFVVKKILSKPIGEKIYILSPLTFEKKETFQMLKERLNRQGFLRIRLNGEYFELDQEIPYEPLKKNELLLVIDRMVVDLKNEQRIYEAVEKAAEIGDNTLFVSGKEDTFFNLSFAVESTGKSYPPITPHTFSFNSEEGMCLDCLGIGMTYGAHLEEDPRILKLSILELCDLLFKEKGNRFSYQLVESYFKKLQIDVDAPLKKIDLDIFLNGGPEITFKNNLTLKWIGLKPLFAKMAKIATHDIRASLLPLMKTNPCSSCEGSRINPLARNVKIKDLSIADFCALPIADAYAWMLSLSVPDFLKETHSQILKSLDFVLSIGLTYLSLDRSAPTLSGGELQRIRLAKQIGSGLTSCLYVLDEPTIGLHPYNNQLLNRALKNLCQNGNTLLLVEHDPLTVSEADYIVDFGPKAGKEGGFITAEGTLEQIKKNPHSLTGSYLSGKKSIPIPEKRRPFSKTIKIENAHLHNLKNITVEIPLSVITCFTGVSGSGKSTLIRHLLKPAVEKALHTKKNKCIEYLGTKFHHLDHFDKVITIDQSPIGQTARADVSTYSEMQPLIRSLFSDLPLAKSKGLLGSHFSPNHLRGMCRTCWGLGSKTIQLQFLPSVKITCPSCRGFKLNPISLEVKFKGKHFGQILQMTVQEALQFFSEIPKIVKKLETLVAVGLSYLHLGLEVASLSGGEAGRLRLSRELSKRSTGSTLYLIDEPSVGLHSEDIAKLIPIFQALADKKNTLILIEHNLDLIANADYIIDLGPDAGALGGTIIAQGTPEEITKSKHSKIAPFLKKML